MFKHVDITSSEKRKGFSYLNRDGDEEFVSLPNGPYNIVTIYTDENVDIYKEDIPKLIKALEAVYNYKD